MNIKQLKSIIGRKIVGVIVTAPTAEKWDTCKLLLDDGRQVQVVFFERHGGTVKVVP